MESLSIYEDSLKEIKKIKKQIATDNISIETSKLDGATKDKLLKAINSVIIDREKAVEKIILGVK